MLLALSSPIHHVVTEVRNGSHSRFAKRPVTKIYPISDTLGNMYSIMYSQSALSHHLHCHFDCNAFDSAIITGPLHWIHTFYSMYNAGLATNLSYLNCPSVEKGSITECDCVYWSRSFSRLQIVYWFSVCLSGRLSVFLASLPAYLTAFLPVTISACLTIIKSLFGLCL